jgi:hypothetical protein
MMPSSKKKKPLNVTVLLIEWMIKLITPSKVLILNVILSRQSMARKSRLKAEVDSSISMHIHDPINKKNNYFILVPRVFSSINIPRSNC